MFAQRYISKFFLLNYYPLSHFSHRNVSLFFGWFFLNVVANHWVDIIFGMGIITQWDNFAAGIIIIMKQKFSLFSPWEIGRKTKLESESFWPSSILSRILSPWHLANVAKTGLTTNKKEENKKSTFIRRLTCDMRAIKNSFIN